MIDIGRNYITLYYPTILEKSLKCLSFSNSQVFVYGNYFYVYIYYISPSCTY
jgi:hypothetical protein